MAQTLVRPKKPDTDGRLVVGVGDMVVTDDPGATVVTHALGSCIGVTVYDPIAKICGMLHFMLPSSKTNPAKAALNPAMFGDTGVPLLFRSVYELGAKKENIVVCAAGGAEVIDDNGHFKVGSRNRTLLRKLFWKNDILLQADETGGNISRTLVLLAGDGRLTVRNRGKERVIWPS